MIELRPYQIQALEQLRDLVRRGNRRVLLQAETGSGKTVAAAELIRLATLKESPCLFLAHRRELVNQCCLRLKEHGVHHGVIMAGKPMTRSLVQIASKDTLLSRAVRGQAVDLPPCKLLIVDECHISLGRVYQELLQRYGDAVIVGLTATPARGDGRGLGDFYQGMVCAVPPSQLIAEGFLVPTRCFAPEIPNLKGIKIEKGDYNKTQLNKRMDKPHLVGNVVRQWQRLAEGRKTIVFASGISHSLHLVAEFNLAGVRAEHIDGKTHRDDRQRLLDDLWHGKIQVLCNVGVLPEGVDVPPVSCAVLARPTRSFVLFRQSSGRIKRPFPGKKDAILIDHAGAVHMHGMPDEDVPWTLETTKKIQDVRKEKAPKDSTPIVCPACHSIFPPAPRCPHCNHVLQKKAIPVHNNDANLVEVTRGQKVEVDQSHEAKKRFWHQCLGSMCRRKSTVAAASCMYKKRYGCWPEAWLPNLPGFEHRHDRVCDLYPQYARGATAR